MTTPPPEPADPLLELAEAQADHEPAGEPRILRDAIEAQHDAEPDIDDDAPLTRTQRQAFLDYVRDHQGCSVREAATAIGVKRKQVRALKVVDADFAEDYREARGYGNDAIRGAMVERAIHGVDEPVYGALGKGLGDGEIGTKRVYSDRLLEFLARMHLPEAKALQAARLGIEVTGAGGGPVQVQQGVSLADVASVLVRARALVERDPAALAGPDGTGAARPALPAAREVLAEPEQR